MHVVELGPNLTDTQFPDRSSTRNDKKRSDTIEIDFDNFFVQGIQRDWNRKVNKQEKKERRRCAQERAGGKKNYLQNESDSEIAAETRSDK